MMPLKFLAVDDEDIVREVLVKTLQRAEPDCIVQQAGNPKEAVRIVKEGFVPDIAFLDIEMFGITGLELAKQIKTISHSTEIVFVTGYSQYAVNAFSVHAHGYLLKPVSLKQVRAEIQSIMSARTVPSEPAPPSPVSDKLVVTCFGNFDVSINGKPLVFPRQKSKELLAYLVNKKGSSCTTKEICAVLFEDKPYTHSLMNQIQTVISTLIKTLEDAGAKDVIIRTRNSIAVNKDAIDCDFYRFLSGEIDAVNSYIGEYMSNYEWADMTTGWLSSTVRNPADAE